MEKRTPILIGDFFFFLFSHDYTTYTDINCDVISLLITHVDVLVDMLTLNERVEQQRMEL